MFKDKYITVLSLLSQNKIIILTMVKYMKNHNDSTTHAYNYIMYSAPREVV